MQVTAPPLAPPLVILPGFGNRSSDYECPFGEDSADKSMVSELESRGFQCHVVPVSSHHCTPCMVNRKSLRVHGISRRGGYMLRSADLGRFMAKLVHRCYGKTGFGSLSASRP